jgi:hypothetical protein
MTSGRVVLGFGLVVREKTADPSASLGMTERGGSLKGEDRCQGTRRSLGGVEGTAGPSAPVGMTRGKVVLEFGLVVREKTADPSASLGMTKGRVTVL